MYPKLKKKRMQIINWIKMGLSELNSISVSINSFLKGKDYLWLFMKKSFHI